MITCSNDTFQLGRITIYNKPMPAKN